MIEKLNYPLSTVLQCTRSRFSTWYELENHFHAEKLLSIFALPCTLKMLLTRTFTLLFLFLLENNKCVCEIVSSDTRVWEAKPREARLQVSSEKRRHSWILYFTCDDLLPQRSSCSAFYDISESRFDVSLEDMLRNDLLSFKRFQPSREANNAIPNIHFLSFRTYSSRAGRLDCHFEWFHQMIQPKFSFHRVISMYEFYFMQQA